MNISFSQDLEYLALFSLVLIFPKMLLRFKIPSGITALLIGTAAGYFDPEIKSDQLFRFLSQICITSLFVFAGLEVEWNELKEDRKYFTGYILVWTVALLIIALGFFKFMGFPFQEALIYSLGIFTPSAGFIINSLHSFKVNEDQEYWIKSKAISKEITAILLLFIALQSGNLKNLGLSVLFYISLFLILPWVFKYFFKFISPHAPNSEVPFLVALSLISGVISKELGAYYLVGAFAVGLIASKFKKQIFKDDDEKSFFGALSSFFNVFLPFYFFFAGLKIDIGKLTLQPLTAAAVLFIVFVPLRILIIRLSVRKIKEDVGRNSYNISLSLMPTLIFGLVIAGILKERAIIHERYIFSLILYTLMTSILPVIIASFKKATGTEQQTLDV